MTYVVFDVLEVAGLRSTRRQSSAKHTTTGRRCSSRVRPRYGRGCREAPEWPLRPRGTRSCVKFKNPAYGRLQAERERFASTALPRSVDAGNRRPITPCSSLRVSEAGMT